MGSARAPIDAHSGGAPALRRSRCLFSIGMLAGRLEGNEPFVEKGQLSASRPGWQTPNYWVTTARTTRAG